MVSNAHAVCAKNLYIVIISATVETSDAMKEIDPAIKMLGDIKEMFVKESPIEVPVHDCVAE